MENVTAMTAEQLKEVLVAAITASKSLNPLEQKALKKELDRERRQQKLSVTLGFAEEEKRWRDQNSCTHSRHEKTGDPVAKGQGQWTTGGQINTAYNQAQLICTRCATMWIWELTPQEREYFTTGGELRGCPPPPIERCLNRDQFVTKRPSDPVKKLAELDAAWEKEHV